MNLPDDMFKQELLPLLTVHDIVKLDNACVNHKYRPQQLDKISGVILRGDKDKYMKASLFKWLGMRRIYLIKMKILVSDFNSTPAITEKEYVDQFRYTQHVEMNCSIKDDMAIFIISHCTCLLSIHISESDDDFSFRQVTDHTLQSIAKHCNGLQSISLSWCREVTDAGFVIISMHCPDLQSLKLDYCDQIADASIISISSHCTRLQSLNLKGCNQITDASIISISTHCTGIQFLHLDCCKKITDVCIISISTHCTELQSLHLEGCGHLTDASFLSISTHCTGIQSLYLRFCRLITDVSIISISENCTGLKEFFVGYTAITDAYS